MATPEELRRSARTAEQVGKPIRAQILYAEADRLEAEQAAAAGRPTAVSSGGAVGPSPTAPMPQTFRPPPASTFVPEPPPPPRDLSVYDTPPPKDFVAAGPPAPGTDAGDFVLEPRDTGVELARGIGTQQTIAIDAADFTGLLGDQPVRTPSMMGIDARTDVFQQYGRTQEAIEDLVERRTFELVMERGLDIGEARRIANQEADRFRRLRADPEGRPTTTGEGGLLDFIPQMRESRIIETEAMDPEGNVVVDEGGFPVMTRMYRDPATGTLTMPTERQEVVESFARQTLPLEEVERNRAERAAMVQQMYQSALDQGAMMLNDEQFARIEAAILDQSTPFMRDMLTSLDRESGKMVETAAGAGLRSFGAFPVMFNEGIMEYTPLFWEQDPETGEPVDPNSYAYRAHEFLKQSLEAAGYTPEQVQNLTTGPIGLGADGVSPGQSLLTMLPKPFQPVQRQEATPVDPTGRRAVPAEASFAGRVAAAVGTGRSGGDELMSMPGMRGETANAMLAPGMGVLADQDVVFLQNNASSVPYFIGLGAEMIYPGAPLVRGTRLAGRAAAKATEAGAGALKRAAKGKRASYLADVPPEMRALLYPEADVVEAALQGVETAADVTEKGAYALSHPVKAAARTRAIRRAQELTEGRYDPVNELDLLKSMHDVRRVTGEATATEILAPYAIQSVLDASEEAVTVQRLIDTIGESPTGRAVLEQADLLGRPGTHVVAPNEVEKLRQAVAETNVSSMRTMLLQIADDAELTFQEQAQNILNQLHAAGIQTRYLPEMQDIRAIADGAVEASPKAALQQMLGPLPTRVQQVAQRPTVQALHELGTQIVRQAQSDEVRRVSGETGRIMARRLGSTPINRTTIGERPDEIFAAARAAGGRLVEARLANAVPDDLVFATKTLMVPRDRLTDEVMFEVSKRMEPFQPEAMVGPVVDGERTVVFRYPLETTGPRRSRVADEIMGVDSVGPAGPPRPTNIVDEIIAAVGVDNIAQSRQYTNIISDIRAGKPLTLEQSAAVQEALQTRAFQEVMGPYAMPAMGFQVDQPRQFERAMQPGVNVGIDTARERQVPMTRAITMSDQGFSSPLAQDVAMVVGEGGGRQIAKVIRDATRDLSKKADELPFDVPPETAPGYQELLAQVRNEFGAISENLRIEMRDLALQPAYKGKPQAAFNAVLRKRVERKMREMEEAIDQRARELQGALRADPKQAYFAIAYRRGAGQDLEGLGEQAANIPDDIRKVALDRERVRIMRNEWESILRDFFGDDAYKAYIEEPDLLDDIIKVPGLRKTGLRPETLADIQPISIKGLVDVIEYARGRQEALRGVGAAVGRTPVTARDAITPVLESWAIGVDQGEAIARANRTLRRENPQLFADLLPSAYSQRPERVFREASLPLTIRRNTMRALRRLSVPKGSSPEEKAQAIVELNRDPRFKQFITRAVNEDGQFYVDRKLTYAMDQTGKFTGELDNIARNMGLRLDPRSRQDLAQQVITQMLETGSPVVDYGKLLRTFDDSPNLALQTMQKQATSEALAGMIRGMDERVQEVRELDAIEYFNTPPQLRREGMKPRDVGRNPAYEQSLLTRAFENSEADIMLYQAIRDARAAGYDDRFIVQMLRQSILETTFNTTIAPIVDEVTANMRAAGFKPQLGKGDLTNMATLARSLDPYDDAVMVLGPDMSEAIAELQASARSGQLAKNLEQLRRRDELTQAMRGKRKTDLLKVGVSYLSDASALSRRAVASGLLGGGVYVGVANFGSDELRTQMQEAIGIEGLPVVLPMPNSRYIGMNALTAPIIAFTTVGMNKAVKAYRPAGGYSRQARDVARQLSTILNKPLVNANSNVPLDSVRFVSDTGRTWTQGEVLSAIKRNNLGSSRGQVEYTEAFVQEAQRDIRLMADGLPTPELRQFARQFDPTRTNIAQYVANASDKALRENIFVTALREGLPEAQAAQLARNVVLDYGAIPPVVRNTINRHVLFASFRLANYAATVNALARDPIMFQKLVRAQQVNQQRTDAWLMGPDYTKARTLLGGEVVFDQDAGAGLFGPALPPMDAMVEMMQMASFIGNVGAEGNDAVKRALDAAKEENLVPILSVVIDNYLTSQDPRGRGMRVPTDVVEWAIQNGPDSIWPYMKKQYNIEPVKPEERLRGRPSAIDPQAPELGPNEYRFRKPEDAERFKWHMTALLYMGIKRTTTDYTNLEMQFNPSDYLRVKRQGIDPTYGLLFGAGAATPLPMGSMSEPARSVLRKAEKAARQAPPQQQR